MESKNPSKILHLKKFFFKDELCENRTKSKNPTFFRLFGKYEVEVESII